MSAAERIVSALEQAGSNPRQRGDQWEARCPAHDDKSPSLGVATGQDGKALIKCQAGCATADVMAALRLTMADLAGDDRQDRTRQRVSATYDYTDETGELLYQVLRTDPKGFRQRRPDGRGGWVWNLGDVRRVPYRLPELLEAVAGGLTVFVCEGEKDADAAVRAGLRATCSPAGAGKWRDEYSTYFANVGKPVDVVVVADKDVPGYRHARDVARSLQPVVGDVRVGLPEFGKDLADHLAAGLDVEALESVTLDEIDGLCGDGSTAFDRLVSTTTNAVRTVVGRFLHSLAIDFSADGPFWSADEDASEWLIPDFVARGRGHALYAEAKKGKSFVALAAIAAAAIPGHEAWTNLPAGRANHRRLPRLRDDR
jgi:hypothetical protein